MTDTENDEIFISGLPLDVTEEEIATYFGQIGIIKEDKKRRGQPKIWLYRDKTTGDFKGEATVTYDDPYAASSAPSWFDNKEFRPGHVIKVSLSDRKANAAAAWNASRGGGGRRGGHGGDGGYGGDRDRGARYDDRAERAERAAPHQGQGRPGDWTCPNCGNNCFARRDSCNRCGTQRGGGGGGGGAGSGREKVGMNRRQGDWMCSCGNNNYGFRDQCFKCHATKPSGAGSGAGGGSGYEGSGQRRQEGEYGRRSSFNHSRDRSRSPRRRHDDGYDSRRNYDSHSHSHR